MKYLIKLLVLGLIKICELRGKVYKIKDRTTDDLYLLRYILFRSKNFSIYIHRFMKSDDDVPHDHPFSFTSYVVDGGYTEHRFFLNNEGEFDETVVNRVPGSLAKRQAEDIHVVKIDRQYTYEERNKAPLTVIFLGDRTRDWGFWTKNYFGKRKWVYWKTYLGLPETFEGIEGQD